MTQHCLAWDQVPETLAPNGIGKRVLEGKTASLVTVRVPAGFAGDRHSHPHEQFVQVLSGSGSSREHVQRLGRILRKQPGKEAILYEVVTEDTTEEHISRRRGDVGQFREARGGEQNPRLDW